MFVMHKVNVTELRNHLPDYLAKAGSGQTLDSSRGRIVARLSPTERTENYGEETG